MAGVLLVAVADPGLTRIPYKHNTELGASLRLQHFYRYYATRISLRLHQQKAVRPLPLP